MSQKNKISATELIRQAYEKVVPREIVEIPLAEGVMKAKMEAPDIFSIARETDIIRAAELHEIRIEQPGLFQEPHNATEWQSDVENAVNGLKRENYDTEEKYIDAVNNARNKKPPANCAEQIAEKQAKMKTIQAIIPKYLKDPETDELLFPTAKDREEFSRYVKANMKLFKEMMDAYVRLFAKMDLGDEAKNSSNEGNSENTNSSNTQPEDTDAAPLTLV